MRVTDQMNREVEVPASPQRIVSLVPSQTELLHALGLENRVVGITKFCLHPEEWYREKPRIGGTKKVNFEKVEVLAPDIIIGNKEENEQCDIEALMQRYPVWMSDIFNLEDALEMIRKVGELTNTSERAETIIETIETGFAHLKSWVDQKGIKSLSVAYFIWKDPDYCAGSNTFIDAMLAHCGLRNYMKDNRYPEFVENGTDSPDCIFLSSEPYPFKEKHIEAFQTKFPEAKVILVDGEMFSWYGSRLTLAPDYFKGLLQQLTSN